MLKFNTKLFKILKVQSNSYSSRWKERWILFLYFRIENIPVFLLRQRPAQDIKLLDSIMPEAFPTRVLTTWDRDENKSLFPKQQHHPSPVPSPSSLLPELGQLFKVFSTIFQFTFLIFTAQFILAMKPAKAFLFVLSRTRWIFFCKSFLHIQFS